MKLIVVYEILGFHNPLYNREPDWKDCSFTMEGDKAYLKMWKEPIEREDYRDALVKFEARIQSFIDIINFSNELKLEHNLIRIDYPLNLAIMEGEIPILLAVSSLSEPPKQLPQTPEELTDSIKRWLKANDKATPVDEKLKKTYLIIEKYKTNAESAFGKDEVDHIRYVRNFVSHSMLTRPNNVAFIVNNLPSAEYFENSKRCARFKPYDAEHIKFVTDYSRRALSAAWHLISDEINAAS